MSTVPVRRPPSAVRGPARALAPPSPGSSRQRDERETVPRGAEVQGSLALDRAPRRDRAGGPRAAAGATATAPASTARCRSGPPGSRRPPSRCSAATGPSRSCCAGRPRRSTHDLHRRVRILRRDCAARQRAPADVRPQVRSVHVCQPPPAAAEVSVHVRHGHRSRAIAARIERRDGRWTCMALQFG